MTRTSRRVRDPEPEEGHGADDLADRRLQHVLGLDHRTRGARATSPGLPGLVKRASTGQQRGPNMPAKDRAAVITPTPRGRQQRGHGAG